MTGLDARLLEAHGRGDLVALVALYLEAADAAVDADAEGFYLTHAHVFAMELGHPQTEALRARLIAAGREESLGTPLPPRR